MKTSSLILPFFKKKNNKNVLKKINKINNLIKINKTYNISY